MKISLIIFRLDSFLILIDRLSYASLDRLRDWLWRWLVERRVEKKITGRITRLIDWLIITMTSYYITTVLGNWVSWDSCDCHIFLKVCQPGDFSKNILVKSAVLIFHWINWLLTVVNLRTAGIWVSAQIWGRNNSNLSGTEKNDSNGKIVIFDVLLKFLKLE